MEELKKLKLEFDEELKSFILNKENLEALKNKYLAKKGKLSQLTELIKTLPNNEKPLFGKELNVIKEHLLSNFNTLENALNKELLEARLNSDKLDLSLDSEEVTKGYVHPLTIIENKIKAYFLSQGYEIVKGPELEDNDHNFTLMNIPKNHPARAMQDSLYFSSNLLLRTHTSPVQAREMLKRKGANLKIIAPGKVYRRDAEDSKHSHQFMQVEGLVIAPNINFGNLKETLLNLLKHLFGEDVDMRMRPSYFPFTEPSIEIDLLIKKPDSSIDYTEILGAGMVHPNVLKMCGYNPKKVNGFAFGIGIERVAMKYFNIDDIRLFYNNDIRFLKQFKEQL